MGSLSHRASVMDIQGPVYITTSMFNNSLLSDLFLGITICSKKLRRLMVLKLRWENLRLYVELKGDSFNTAKF